MQVADLIEWMSDDFIEEKECKVGILRLDKIHPVISGNKYFKLKYYLEEAIRNNRDTIITFGGYYSNHLHATAFACNTYGLKSVGYVRGEEPSTINDTLKDCIKFGMELKFIPQGDFKKIQEQLTFSQPQHVQIIPMGGNGVLGMRGAGEILNFKTSNEFDYIIGSAGTGTMGGGLLHKLEKYQQLVLISAVKNNFSLKEEILALDPSLDDKEKQLSIHHEFHFGGFGKSNPMLFEKMNWFYKEHQIPTDFVYTGKMICGFYELLRNNSIRKKSKILLIHSGGIQGNRSLKAGILNF
jgi:1-aminocyclopropane-1-carboxylate deaminase